MGMMQVHIFCRGQYMHLRLNHVPALQVATMALAVLAHELHAVFVMYALAYKNQCKNRPTAAPWRQQQWFQLEAGCLALRSGRKSGLWPVPPWVLK